MNGANHKPSGISTYPFQIFGNGWKKVMPALDELPCKGDTVIGHDVWIGYDALTMPGVRIGNGAIVASRGRWRALPGIYRISCRETSTPCGAAHRPSDATDHP